MKTNYQNIYARTRQMLLKPEAVWPEVLEEDCTVRDIFYHYLFPLTLATSIFVLLFSLFSYTVWQAIGMAIIQIISALGGIWCAYLIIREYLCRKLSCQDNHALNLTVYSSALFILFHGIGVALGNIFIGQLFTVLSFIFIRTLYKGIWSLSQLKPGQKNNILVIATLAIICMPIIISHILMIIFRISAIQV